MIFVESGSENLPQYKKDYWGFVYLWRDRINGTYCIGSHLGSWNDGYLSSTGHLKAAYDKRPTHFMRRILYWLRTNDRKRLLQEEARWLSFIPLNELRNAQNVKNKTVRYYNSKKFAVGGAWNKGQTGVQSYIVKECEHCKRVFKHGMYAAWHGEKCLQNPQLTEVNRNSRSRRKLQKQPAYVADNINTLPLEKCFVCGMETSRGNIARWHGIKCVPRRSRPDVIAQRPTSF